MYVIYIYIYQGFVDDSHGLVQLLLRVSDDQHMVLIVIVRGGLSVLPLPHVFSSEYQALLCYIIYTNIL